MKQFTRFRTTSYLSTGLKMTWKLTAIFCMGTVVAKSATNYIPNVDNFSQTEVANNSLQQNPIKGTVKDEDGMPIPGVNVLVKGTTIGTTTDIDGKYVISAPSTAKILVFSYLGLKSSEVAINGKSVVNASLKSDASALEEVVVVGYGTVRKSDVTGALSSVSTDEMNKTQNTSIAQAIQGRAAGVTVSKGSGGPGATPTVRIRGVGTVNNADPLYVVDGVPISDISSVNMADAKSVEVLKDASATAIYGSRGANGVVLITTNGGKKGKTVISYKTYTSFDKRVDNLDVLNAQQWGTLYNEANANDGNPADPNLANPATLPNYDWKNAAYRGGGIQSHQVSASGGTEKTTFYIGFGYINQKGVIDQSSYKRTNFRINNTYQITPKIKIGNNIQYAVSNTQSIPSYGNNSNAKAAFSGFFIDPVTPFYNADGSYSIPKYAAQPINPLGLTQYGVTPEKKENFLGSVFVDAEIIKDLTFRSNFGLQINNTSVDNFKPPYYVSPLFSSPVSTYNLSRTDNRSIILSNTLNYNKTIAKKHYITALLGQEIQNANQNNVNASRNSIPASVGQPTISAGDVASSTNGGSISQSKLLSFFGRFNYNYADRYLLTGTYRMDASSRFGANNRWAKFPSLAGAWNVHKENFFKVDAISQFKVRAGWGETGNQNIPNAAIYNTLNVGTNSIVGTDESTALGVAPLTPGNANLKWETTITTNVGLDMGFLNNSITFTADYFIKNTSDMLMATPILFSSGYANSPYTNAGNIQNKGLELTANYKKTIKNFSFNVGGNISFIRNKVTALASQGSIIQTGDGNNFYNISRTEVGHPLASFYGYQMLGIFQNQNEINNSPSLLNTKPGDVKYKDVDGDGQITDNDRTYIGSPFPKFTYGLNLDLAYKQFDFTAFFQGSQGNKIFNTTDYWLEGDYASNSSTSVLGRWTGEGTSNTVPRATFTNAGNNNLQSSRFVKDGSYLRLKNVQLGYTFTKSVLDAISLQNLRIYVAAQNLLTFTKYDGVDPELGVDASQNSPLDIGIDRGRYPTVRSFSLGLDINF
ncbi:SusC/RagA family TonB-linked outer membrane protein [Flavobacterium sp. 7A]|uniref:SusC/RagA family TonB-linked outer membrane protein n=1 Tax=Flavobacterium sp. 7A TaxID=2940571 RepID=UPI0022275EB8|nr:TonB-dependent receptor [Flavobacterium sp. 7A]MCW2118821.1 TonB-linked SusC/RagA family outer membrane protein [Flavobacterium sp. 7A]